MKILNFTTSLMDRSKDFRYFGLIASFCLMLDLTFEARYSNSVIYSKRIEKHFLVTRVVNN